MKSRFEQAWLRKRDKSVGRGEGQDPEHNLDDDDDDDFDADDDDDVGRGEGQDPEQSDDYSCLQAYHVNPEDCTVSWSMLTIYMYFRQKGSNKLLERPSWGSNDFPNGFY